jgi:hypothetical protein
MNFALRRSNASIISEASRSFSPFWETQTLILYVFGRRPWLSLR